MIHIPVEQNTDAWWAEKLGRPSASNADKIITDDGKPSKQREGYLYELVAERITGQRDMASYANRYMEIGKEREDEARSLYELIHDCTVTPGGVCFPDEAKAIVCSPDGIVEGSHGLEIKNPAPKTHVKYLLKNELPQEYFGQVQFSLFVTGLPFWDFMSYSPGLKPLFVRVKRDEVYSASLKKELARFCADLEAICGQLKGGA